MPVMKPLSSKQQSQLQLLSVDTALAFQRYIVALHKFKKAAGLKTIDNVHEICNAMTDKHGRICRHIKHVSRNDPKADWPTDALESMVGYLAYMDMLMTVYNLHPAMPVAMNNEMSKAIKQHSKKG